MAGYEPRAVAYLNRSAYFYAAQLSPAQEGAAAAATTVTVHAVYNHASIAKPATVPQDAVSQGMYWRGDLLGGAAAGLVDPLQPGKVQVKVKCVHLLHLLSDSLPHCSWGRADRHVELKLPTERPRRARQKSSCQPAGPPRTPTEQASSPSPRPSLFPPRPRPRLRPLAMSRPSITSSPSPSFLCASSTGRRRSATGDTAWPSRTTLCSSMTGQSGSTR